MACQHCRGYEVYDHGFDIPDRRSDWIVNHDSEEDGAHDTASITVYREWFTCNDCGVGMDYRVTYKARLPDGREFTAYSEYEAARLIQAVYPNAERDYDAEYDRKTSLREMGIMC